jgi:hypothetical protein
MFGTYTRSISMRTLVVALIVSVASAAFAQQRPAPKRAIVSPASAAVAKKSPEPLTLSMDELYARERLLPDIDRMTSDGASLADTAEYARSYDRLKKQLAAAKPPVSEWTPAEQARVSAIPTPTNTAIATLLIQKRQVEQDLIHKQEEAQREREEAQRQQIARDKIDEEKRANEKAEAQRQQAIAAQERQAAAAEAQAEATANLAGAVNQQNAILNRY